jgi:hypothetical protein
MDTNVGNVLFHDIYDLINSPIINIDKFSSMIKSFVQYVNENKDWQRPRRNHEWQIYDRSTTLSRMFWSSLDVSNFDYAFIILKCNNDIMPIYISIDALHSILHYLKWNNYTNEIKDKIKSLVTYFLLKSKNPHDLILPMTLYICYTYYDFSDFYIKLLYDNKYLQDHMMYIDCYLRQSYYVKDKYLHYGSLINSNDHNYILMSFERTIYDCNNNNINININHIYMTKKRKDQDIYGKHCIVHSLLLSYFLGFDKEKILNTLTSIVKNYIVDPRVKIGTMKISGKYEKTVIDILDNISEKNDDFDKLRNKIITKYEIYNLITYNIPQPIAEEILPNIDYELVNYTS